MQLCNGSVQQATCHMLLCSSIFHVLRARSMLDFKVGAGPNLVLQLAAGVLA